MQRWQQSSKGSTQLSAKLPEALKEDFREICEEQGETMTDVIVDLMAQAVEERKGTRDADNVLPDDERLLKAWRVLRHNAAPDTNVIPLKSAESLLANELNVPKHIILHSVIQPLERHEPPMIVVEWAKVEVRDPREAGE